jgi:hypothetical protein
MKKKCFLAQTILSLTLTACASQRPVLYPNEHLKRVGNTAADQDINDCMQRAEEYVSSGGGGQALEHVGGSSATEGAIGAAAGAAGGSVVGRPGTGAAVGGAAGATRGLIRGLTRKQNPSPVYKTFVNRCLREKGYDPIGWQ